MLRALAGDRYGSKLWKDLGLLAFANELQVLAAVAGQDGTGLVVGHYAILPPAARARNKHCRRLWLGCSEVNAARSVFLRGPDRDDETAAIEHGIRTDEAAEWRSSNMRSSPALSPLQTEGGSKRRAHAGSMLKLYCCAHAR